MKKIIVSRHVAAIQFIAEQIHPGAAYMGGEVNAVVLPDGERIPVLSQATIEDVRGKVVYGNIPLHLARYATAVVAVEFASAPPRGQDYDLTAMKAAGAKLETYAVFCGTAQEVVQGFRTNG